MCAGVYGLICATVVANVIMLSDPVRALGALSPNDPSSYSRPELAVVRHVKLNLKVDFDKKILSGMVLLNFESLQEIDEVVLDVSSLTIDVIELENDTTLKYKLDEYVPNFGSKLTISLPQIFTPAKLAVVRHVKLNLKVDFDKKILSGMVLLNFESLQEIDEVVLDVSSLTIDVIELENDTTLKYKLDEYVPNFGSKLTISLPQIFTPASTFSIRIQYATHPAASALQWLEPLQTSGKKYPYLFTQSSPIHARSFLPCQDTPSVKFTYEAEITAPEPFTILMSALTKERQSNKTTFYQPVPIPSCLFAIVVAVLERRTIGPRTTVWSEEQLIEQSAWEFAHIEQYLQAAEKLCGPYVWTQYDILVLPLSFLYGGMENPCLTFVSPSLLVGDRSLANVIVHEIFHSWTGNLVTIRNYEHFWMKEGFTVYLERKVVPLIEDPPNAMKTRDFYSIKGVQELNETVNQLGIENPLTKLVVNLTGVHPDDSLSTVPYEKGSLFIRYLEDVVGCEEFEGFVRSYIDHFMKQSIKTDQFKEYLLGYFAGKPAAEKLTQVQWDQWLYAPGMPPVIPNYDTSMEKAVTDILEKISKDPVFSSEDVKGFNPHQKMHLLQELIGRAPLPANRLEELGASYGVANSRNTEIRFRWLRLCVKSRILARLPEVLQFVNQQGRMKYVRPLYRDLYAWEEARQRAIDNFLENERYMMHVSAYTVRQDLHL